MKIGAILAALVAVGVAAAAVIKLQPAPKSPDQKAAEFAESLPKPSAEGPQPRLTVEPALRHEFGDMALGDTGRHTFVIRNEGEGPLRLKAKATTCKCTLSDLEESTIPPGGSKDVELEWTPKNSAAEFVQYAYVATNDPETPELKLEIAGRVAMPIMLQPAGEIWDIGTVAESGPPTEFVGAVASELETDLRVTGSRGSADYLSVSAEPFTDEQLERIAQESGGQVASGAAVTVTVEPGMEVGRFRVPLTLTTNSEKVPEVTVYITGTRAGPFAMLGGGWNGVASRLDLKAFPAAKGKERTLVMLVEDLDEPLEFTNVAVEPPVLEVDFRDAQANVGERDKYEITVSVPPGVAPAMYEDEKAVRVSADVNHPRFSKLAFDVTFRATP